MFIFPVSMFNPNIKCSGTLYPYRTVPFSNSQPLKPLEADIFEKRNSDPKDSKLLDFCTNIPEFKNNQGLFLSSIQDNNAKVSFGYKHALKTAWKEGRLPSVTKGLYGKALTKENITLEHLTPVSKGGRTTLDNLALAEREANMSRGTKPLAEVITFKQLMDYLNQFKNVRTKGVNGNKYIKRLLERATNEWHLSTN